MASRSKSTAGTSDSAEATRTAEALGDAMDDITAQNRRLIRGWTSAYSVALQGWSDLMKVSADTVSRAAKAFDEAIK